MLSNRFVFALTALAVCLAGVAPGRTWAQERPIKSDQAIVTYKNGSLTIKAHDVPLADVLHAVGRETGARLDIPGEAYERVAVDLGPGPAREVLTSLLQRQGLNYAVTGSGGDPKGLQVFILPRSHVDAAPTATTQVTASSGSATPVMQHPSISPRVVPDEHKEQMRQLLAQARADLADFPAAGDGGDAVFDAATAAKFLNQIEADFGTVSEGGTPATPAGIGVPTGNGERDGNPSPIAGHPGHRPH